MDARSKRFKPGNLVEIDFNAIEHLCYGPEHLQELKQWGVGIFLNYESKKAKNGFSFVTRKCNSLVRWSGTKKTRYCMTSMLRKIK